jgi:hypothetical protein
MPNPSLPVTNAPNPPAKDPLTPGWQTSEGQIAAVVTFLQTLIYLLTVFHVVKWDQEQQKAISQIIPITLTLTAGLYGFARAHVKASAVGTQKATTIVSAVGDQQTSTPSQ